MPLLAKKFLFHARELLEIVYIVVFAIIALKKCCQDDYFPWLFFT